MARTGVWIIGAVGGLATTVITGATAIVRGIAERRGLTSDAEPFAPLRLIDLKDLVFGGHDVRGASLVESAREISTQNGSISRFLVDQLEDDLEAINGRIRCGTAWNVGGAVDRLTGRDPAEDPHVGSLRQQIGAIQADLDAFQTENGLTRVVVVNLASTEPSLPVDGGYERLADLDRALDDNRRETVRASLLYAYAALDRGHPYINFTPSGCLIPAIAELAEVRGAPFMGSDGKTGETLVKSALAPMFRHRDLRVMSWQGYNILGDRDGEVLSDKEHLETKVKSKDRALQSILGYPLHTHVGIDYVPSLGDMKTAWDFIHFEGFLGHKMAMQFIWQGCDAILAAPLVLDMIRLADYANRVGERGPMHQLAAFFKSPFGVDEHDLHRQMIELHAYANGRGPDGEHAAERRE